VKAVATDHRGAGLPAPQVAMLDFVEGVSAVPPRSSAATVEGLRGHGWSDAAILDMVQVAAYFAYVNRMADGLGVELESSWPEEIRRGG
jgi:alkylhydroperoxidase family enzyme